MRLFCSKKHDAGDGAKEKDAPKEARSMGKRDVDRFGLYQVVMYAIISVPLFLTAGFTLAYVFTAGEVKYRCLVPECEHPSNNSFDAEWVANAAPKVEGQIGTCLRYVLRNDSLPKCSEDSFTNVTRTCDAWVFDPTEHTIQSEWNLTCDTNRWKLTLIGTMNNVGQFFGLSFAGYVSDRYGRRTMLTLATCLTGISGLIQSFSSNYWMFLAFEFLDASFAAGIYSAGFILGMEMTGVKNRVMGSTIISCMFALGEIILGFVASSLRSWRTLLRVAYGPALLTILLPVLIPESVRWLMAKGKHAEVEKIYRKMARMNGLEISQEAIGIFKEQNVTNPEESERSTVTDKRAPVVQILNSSVILIRLVICSFCWLTNTFVYYGLSLNSVAFAGDKYVNFMLVAVVEIPAYICAWILTDYVGRKITLSASFLLSGICCLVIQFIPPDTWQYLPLIVYMGGKWCITMAFATVYVYTAELFPTSLRHSLLGICSMTGRIGSILSPQTPLLAQIMPELPLILFGCMGVSAGLLSLTFPETLGTKLPDTVWDAENIGKTRTKPEERESPS
ncbi:hypothetical protein KM043_007284 [Ampulex compressa]|nr:hypothetical protein KM043_007284 [Ampulex compressa]